MIKITENSSIKIRTVIGETDHVQSNYLMSRNRIYQIKVAGVSIKVTKKKVKHLRIVAYPTSGEVRISSPEHLPDAEIRNFANSKADWIRKHLNNPQIKPFKDNTFYKNGSILLIWGVPHTLNIIDGANRFRVKVNGEQQVLMRVKNDSGPSEWELVMREWYRGAIKSRIPSLIKKWEPRMNVKVSDWGVKKMKTRWGTCNTRAKRIWVNLELAKRDPEFLEYIVVHEMTHLLERPHSSKFYRLMDSFLSGWRETDKKMGGRHWHRS